MLGPVEGVRLDGTPLRIPAGRARTVLALLCANSTQVVSRDRLIDEAWCGEPPSTAATQLHGLVSALRRALGAASILTRGDGYMLGSCELDLTRMRALVRRAAALRAGGSPEGAAECLHEALAAWRGRPFGGISCVELESAADLIEQEHAGVLEEYAEIELALGNAASMTERLAEWVARHPLRERLRALLIEALLLSGRQAEAVAAYHDLRQRLADELGVDPGPALRDLYLRILKGAPSVPIPDAAAPVPAQLPAAVPDFSGRATLVAEMTAALSRGAPAAVVVTALYGMGGTGKSTLAVHVAQLVRAEFPDGQLFVNLAGMSAVPAATGDILARLLRDLGVAEGGVPAGFDERLARYRSMLAGRRLLLVLDDARDAAQVRPLLPGSPTCAALVTSRVALPDLAGAAHLGLPAMEPDEARDLFTSIVGAHRAAAEPDAVTQIVRACAGLPLAIRIAATRLAVRPGWSIAELAGRLAAEHDRLAELHSGDLAVRASFRLSYDGLDPGVADGFGLLGLLPPGPFGLPPAAALLGLPLVAARRLLETLADQHMLECPEPDTYRLHDLLRLFAAELAAELAPNDRAAAIGRLVRWYAAALRGAAGKLADNRPIPPGRDVAADGVPPFDSHHDALDWCHREQANLAWAMRSAAEGGAHELTARMAVLVGMYAERSGSTWTVAMYEIGLDSARRVDDRPARAWLLVSLGGLLSGQLSELHRQHEGIARIEQGMALYEALGDAHGVGRARNNLGTAYHNLARFQDALDQFELAASAFDAPDLERLHAMALSNAGTACRSLADYDAALDRYGRALRIRQRLGDRHGEGASRTSLGIAYRLMGRLDASLEQHRLAVAAQRELGTGHWWLLSALDELGQTLAALGRSDEARESWAEAAILAGSAGDVRATEFRGRLAPGTPTASTAAQDHT